MTWDILKRYYTGFYIKSKVGNNQFSYEDRTHRQLHVAPFVEGQPGQLRVGSEIAFSEVNTGQEQHFFGLEQFIGFQHNGTPVYIFDNHNHAFFGWCAALATGTIRTGGPLVHVDQHSDMRVPTSLFNHPFTGTLPLEAAFDYGNQILNVGNFIQPALKGGLFSEFILIDSSTSFEFPLPEQYVLDIDIDIFAPEMDYIDYAYKMEQITDFINNATFITVATSPYFIDQQKAIDIIKELFGS